MDLTKIEGYLDQRYKCPICRRKSTPREAIKRNTLVTSTDGWFIDKVYCSEKCYNNADSTSPCGSCGKTVNVKDDIKFSSGLDDNAVFCSGACYSKYLTAK